MLKQGARIAIVLTSLLVACGGERSDPTPDGGGTAGSGGRAGSSGAGAGGSGGAGATAGGAGNGGGGTGGGTGGNAGNGGTTGGTAGSGPGGMGGTSGDGGPAPFVATVKNSGIGKIDLLFMIDNSSSMSDKQNILATAVPDLVNRLIEPKCIDPVVGRVVGNPVNGVCVVGELEFAPIKDIHIGIVSSSLGNHGAAGVCEDAIDIALGRSDPHNNDQGRLIARGSGGTNVPTFQNKGFLYYNPSVPGGLQSSAAVAAPFTDMVKGVGQHGCGYEASLESVYRFLIDPDPYSVIFIDTSVGGFGQALLKGTDTMLLQQRKDFLRSDSLVSIVLVTDENDCSIFDGGQGFYAIIPPVPGTGRSVLRHGTSACLTNPNDPCCFNCGQQTPPAGCAPADGDPECMKGEYLVNEDQPNLRCFNQKKRYGVDFLYSVQRYIDGFTKTQIPNRRNELVQNPLFSDLSCTTGNCPSQRDPTLVYVAGIVGVPWQDIAVDPNDLSAGYKTARKIDDDGVWLDIVGDPTNPGGPIAPRDPHMIESIEPRAGLPGPGSAYDADRKNGHEWSPSKDQSQPNADLQYACIFDLVPPRVCIEAMDCDCFGSNLADVQNPLCQNAQGVYTNTQLRAKAYPSPRILQVLRGIGNQAIVGSICPAQTTTKERDDFGYAPSIEAVIRRLRQPLVTRCLSLALPVDTSTGQTSCTVIESFNDSTCGCDSAPGRRTARADLITDEMRAVGNCHCEIVQTTGAARSACVSLANPPANVGDGWCYVDPAQQSDATCEMVQGCASDQQRKIRFINSNSEPRPGAYAFLRCDAQPITPLPPRCP